MRQQVHKVRNVPLCLFLAAAREFRLEIWRFIAKSLPQANRSVSRCRSIWKKHGLPGLNWADLRQDRSSWRRLANWQIPRFYLGNRIWSSCLAYTFLHDFFKLKVQDSKQYLGQVSFEPLHIVFIQVGMPHSPIQTWMLLYILWGGSHLWILKASVRAKCRWSLASTNWWWYILAPQKNKAGPLNHFYEYKIWLLVKTLHPRFM